MKSIIIVILGLSALNISFTKEEPNIDSPTVLEKIINSSVQRLVAKKGSDGSTLIFQPGELVPFTGWAKMKRGDGVQYLQQMKMGKKEGFSILLKNGIKQ